MTLEDEVTRLRAENTLLKQQLAQALERLAVAEQRLAELEHKTPASPSFGKAKTPKRERKPRRKRKPEHNRAWRLATPTRVERHVLERCPDCGLKLQGMSLGRRRQVIELPPPHPVEVIEHHVIKRWCPHCERWHAPHLDLRGQVLGPGRMGVRIVSLIAYLRTTLRLPVRRIRVYLQTLHHLTLSPGEIVALLHQVRRGTQTAVDHLKARAGESRGAR